MRNRILLSLVLLASALQAPAQISIHVALPPVDLGLRLPLRPELVEMPGTTACYVRDVDADLYYQDGTYWLLREGCWYASPRTRGPWAVVRREYVPGCLVGLRPRRFERYDPPYQGWRRGPEFRELPGRDWPEHRHGGWDREGWEHRSRGGWDHEGREHGGWGRGR
ncbi:hypothetical protein [Mesoterricola silvestris]|uniref:Uncharacterized protein n=1 Tax=Mesoterricola silvestris TaxID=2927979 RepID=A0AA48GNU6_9BACT|nr:hypothetical protein [Mesoterricola silvestris]BDU73334.1 hypothetical protein METEAL_25080 [Mesoterricola silvestris]